MNKKGQDEENSEDDLTEDIVKDSSETEDMDEDAHEGFLLSDESDINNHDSDIEEESLI